MKFKDIYDIAVPYRKRREEHLNFLLAIALRPASILVTAPLLKTKVKPITITKISVFFLSLCLGFLSFSNSMKWRIMGWICLYIWGVLDCVDGNLARCTNQCSQLGDLWDTMGGYIAMIVIYFSAGIAAYYDKNLLAIAPKYYWLILGGASAIFAIFPRLVMQKKKAYHTESASVTTLSDKEHFGLSKVIALNFISPISFIQIILLMCICFHLLNLFTVFYFIVNLGVMLLSLHSLLKE